MHPAGQSSSHCHAASERGFTLLELLVVVGLTGVLAGMAVPMMTNTMADFRITGDARGLHSAMSVAKMRAAAAFSQARVYVDLDQGAYRVETLTKGAVPAWSSDGGLNYFATGVSPGYADIAAAPPNTQNSIGQAAPCRTAAGATIGNTACVVFNSRGIPVDSTSAPTALDALYLTDGVSVYAATVEASGMIELWKRGVTGAEWVRQ